MWANTTMLRIPYDKTEPITLCAPEGVVAMRGYSYSIYAIGARLQVPELDKTGTITWMSKRLPTFRMRMDHERQDRVFAQGSHTFYLVGYKAPAGQAIA